MDSGIGINIKLFIRNKFCSICCYCLFVLMSSLLLYFCSANHLFRKDYVGEIDALLKFSIKLSYLYFPAIGIIAGNYFRQIHDNHFWEFSKNINLKKIYRSQILVLNIFNFFLSIFVLIFNTAVFLYSNQGEISLKFVSYIAVSILMEYFLVGNLSIYASLLFSRIENKAVRYTCFFGFHFIFGYPAYWLLNGILTGIKYNRLANVILNLTEILSESFNFGSGYLYIGTLISLHRIVLILLWIQIFKYFYFVREDKAVKHSWRNVILILVLFLLYCQPYSKSNGYVKVQDQFDYFYNQAERKVNTVDYEQTFDVSEYEIVLMPGLGLHAKATVKIDKSAVRKINEKGTCPNVSDEQQTICMNEAYDTADYDFTLLESLQLQSVRDEYGNHLPYVRLEDYVTVTLPEQSHQIVFFYKGTVEPFYAEFEGIYLPGGIAYYPIPGRHPIYVNGRGDNNVNIYMNHIKQKKTHYKIEVKSLQKVFCSLPETENNTFEGDTGSFFLVSGLVEEDFSGNTRIILPALAEFATESCREEKEEQIIVQYNEVLLEKGWETLEDKTVFVSGLLNCTEVFDVNDDYIEIPWLYPDIDFKDFYRREIEENTDAGN